MTTGLSIVIPTRGGGPLRVMLRSLEEALPLGAPVEVLVVVDGAVGPSDSLRGLSLDLEVLPVPERRGPAHARNLGVRRATHDVVAFLDDDVVVPVTWYEAVREILEGAETPWDLLGGDIRSVRIHNLVSQMFEALVIRHAEVNGRWYLSTANILVRREAFERIGGFDERFPDAAGEDWDLCRRAHAAGLRVKVTDSFGVHHWNPTQLTSITSRARRYAASSPIRFAPWRPALEGVEDPVVRFARRVRSPIRVLASPVTMLLPNFLRRYSEVRRRGHGRIRSIAILGLHLPWFLVYAWASYLTLRRHGSDHGLDIRRRSVETPRSGSSGIGV